MKTASVLLIDSHLDTREMYAEYMRTVNLRPIQLGDTSDALARAQHADIIVTGIRIPGPFDGLELVSRLRAVDTTRRKPIIVLTACTLEPDRNRALTAGCSAFLAKPCLPEVLVEQIRFLLVSAPVAPDAAEILHVATGE